MKATLSTLLLCVGAVSAVAVADPVAEPVAEPKNIKVTPGKAHYQGRLGFCGVAGSSCNRMKRSAEAIAEAFAETDPDARYQGRFGFCGVAGSSCHKARRSIEEIGEIAERSYMDISAREAQPEPMAKKIQTAKGRFGFCGPAGVSCKRDAEAEPKKIQTAKGRFGFCGPAGVACKRDAGPEPKKIQRAKGRFGFCGPAGVSCKMVKRDPRYQGRFGFCGVAGSSCKRDANAEAVAAIARSIDEWDPSYLTEVCLEEGGECSALIKARNAFMDIKRETESVHAKRAAEDIHADAKRAAEEEDITETLDELEAALEEAVASI